MSKKEEKLGMFMLQLTPEERKKLKLISIQRETTMQSLIRHLLHTGKTLEQL